MFLSRTEAPYSFSKNAFFFSILVLKIFIYLIFPLKLRFFRSICRCFPCAGSWHVSWTSCRTRSTSTFSTFFFTREIRCVIFQKKNLFFKNYFNISKIVNKVIASLQRKIVMISLVLKIKRNFTQILFRFALAVLKLCEPRVIQCRTIGTVHSCLSKASDTVTDYKSLAQVRILCFKL